MSRARFIVGDTRAVVASLPDQSVDLILTSPPFLALRSYLPDDHREKSKEIGASGDPAAFVDALLDLVADWRRVLTPHGTIAVELGDSYSRGKRGWPSEKSLALVPELLRVALAYGRNPLTGREVAPWVVRNVVRWCRPNPPIGALGDKFRPATSDILVACLSGDRFFDLDAVRRPANAAYAQRRFSDGWGTRPDGKEYASGAFLSDEKTTYSNPNGVPPYDWWSAPVDSDELPGDPEEAVQYLLTVVEEVTCGGDPLDRDTWEIPTEAYRGAHTATWPRELCARAILSMCPEKVCRVCGQPAYVDRASDGAHVGEWVACDHDDWRPGVVLDPFASSGTTLAVAVGNGRDAIGVDLDERNADLALGRVGMFLELERFDPGAAA